MANPQKENGYTAIANEILEEVAKRDFNGTQLRIILAIWRLTYGYQRKSHAISIGFLADLTGIEKRYLRQQLKKLIDANVILVYQGATYTEAREIGFNKDYDEWSIPRAGEKGTDVQRGTKTPQGCKSTPGVESHPRGVKVPLGRGVKTPLYKEKEINNINTTKEEEGRGAITPQGFKNTPPNPFEFYQQNFGVISPFIAEELDLWLTDGSFSEPEEITILAMKEALNNNVRRWSYVNNILRDWRDQGLKTVKDVEAYKLEWQRQKQQKAKVQPISPQQDGPIYRKA